jgi:hypothetical protein
MTIYPLYLNNLQLGPVYAGSDFYQLIADLYQDFDVDTGAYSSFTSIQATCHKTALSLTYTDGYLEICFGGTKVKSYTNEYYQFDGVSLIQMDCILTGNLLVSQI